MMTMLKTILYRVISQEAIIEYMNKEMLVIGFVIIIVYYGP